MVALLATSLYCRGTASAGVTGSQTVSETANSTIQMTNSNKSPADLLCYVCLITINSCASDFHI